MEADPVKFKKKKKKSFLQKVKKFGKQGQRGRGTDIDQDQYDYLVRVLERWKEEFENDEEKKIFVGNVMETTLDNERLLAGNQLGSRVIEMLLPSASPEIIQKFSNALSSDLRLVCLDPYMSHVLEKLLLLQSFTSNSNLNKDTLKSDDDHDKGDDDDEAFENSDWVLKVCKFVINNCEDFCTDVYASHLLRTCSECLTGSRHVQLGHGAHGNQSRTAGYDELTVWRYRDNKDVISNFDDALETYVNRLVSLTPDYVLSELCVRVIDVFCHLTSSIHKELCKKIISHLLDSVLGSGVDLEDNNSVRLCETVVTYGVTHGDLRQRILSQLIDTREEELCCHSAGNFIIQRLLDHVDDKEMFVKMSEMMSGLTETILEHGCTGVVLSLAKSAVRLSAGQTGVMNKIIDALHCQDDTDSIAPCLMYMRTKESLNQEEASVHLHGSLILQQLLMFSKPIKVVRSLLQLPASQLSQLLSDPRGCHVTDSFMTSSHVGEKSRESLVKSLRGEFVALATSKHGSRTLDTLWKHSTVKTKQLMVEELSHKLDILNSNKFASFIVKNWYIGEFKRNKADWLKLIEKENKIADDFSDIIGSKVVTKRKHDVSSNNTETPVVKKKKEVADLVDDWLKPESDTKKEKKKKKKAKSYLDDL